MTRLAGYTGPEHVTDEFIRYWNERTGDHDIEAKQRFYWVERLVDAVSVLASQREASPWPYFSVFWTRLHGLISEMRCAWLDDLRRVGVDRATHAATPGSLLDRQLELLRAIDLVHGVFSEDELIYADYRRHTESHSTQSSYAVRWSQRNGGQVLDRRGVPSVGKEFTVAEMTAAVRRVFVPFSHGGIPDERLIAVNFAERIRAPLAPVLTIMRRDFVST